MTTALNYIHDITVVADIINFIVKSLCFDYGNIHNFSYISVLNVQIDKTTPKHAPSQGNNEYSVGGSKIGQQQLKPR